MLSLLFLASFGYSHLRLVCTHTQSPLKMARPFQSKFSWLLIFQVQTKHRPLSPYPPSLYRSLKRTLRKLNQPKNSLSLFQSLNEIPLTWPTLLSPFKYSPQQVQMNTIARFSTHILHLPITCPKTFLFALHLLSLMFPEVGRPRVTEIQVRIDCNGCVQKIKKALHGIHGIYDLYIDLPQQKLTVVGWADPEKIVKAIKKTRKLATICSHTEAADPSAQPIEPPPPPPDQGPPPPPDQGPPPPPPDQGPPPPPDGAPPPTNQGPPPEPMPPPPPENPPPEGPPPPAVTDPTTTQPPPPQQPSGPKDVEEIHVIHHHPPGLYGNGPPSYSTSTTSPSYYSHGGHGYNWNSTYPPHVNGHHGYRVEPSVHVTHSYNTYRPSPLVSEYQYVASPPRHTTHYQYHNRAERYSDYQDYHYRSTNGDGNITSMFSDENPNACRIV